MAAAKTLETPSFKLQLPARWDSPVLIDSPHSGILFPAEYPLDVKPDALLRWVDNEVHQLYEFAPALGIPLLDAKISRCFLDLNRHRFDVSADLVTNDSNLSLKQAERTLQNGNGLLKRFGPNGENIFDLKIDKIMLLELLSKYYHPYYGVLNDLIFQCYDRFGKVVHLNCHAMLPINKATGEMRPDIVISNNNRMTASTEITDLLRKSFEENEFSVWINNPFLGGEIVREFGKPAYNQHSIQIEINKQLYLEVETFKIAKEKFTQVQRRLQKTLQSFTKSL